jgi:hypothetical protein
LGFGIWDLGFGIWNLEFEIWDFHLNKHKLTDIFQAAFFLVINITQARFFLSTFGPTKNFKS